MADTDRRLDAELLLEHLDWVRGLARRLVMDGGAAEDVVQETALAALRWGGPGGGAARAWLGRVARNAARQARRAEATRRGHEERAARAAEAEGADDVVARARLQRRVVDAVLALDEPYRSTVLLRFFEGLPPR